MSLYLSLAEDIDDSLNKILRMTLTDRKFWLDYWESKKNLIFEVPQHFILTNFLTEIAKKQSIKSALEIGGFPGHYTIYLKKYLQINSSLLDYVIHQKIIDELLLKNGLKSGDIGIIEGNLFEFDSEKKYDLVFSNGLIEHFDDTELVIKKHVELLSENGQLFISLPNFRGINGWFQQKFDNENYLKHNIDSMNIEKLKVYCQNLQLKNIKVFYNGVFMVWLENEEKQPFSVKILKKTVWVLGKIVSRILRRNSRILSPYIVILANK